MLKLKLQYFGHLMQRADSIEKTLMLGKTEGRRKRGDVGQKVQASRYEMSKFWGCNGMVTIVNNTVLHA